MKFLRKLFKVKNQESPQSTESSKNSRRYPRVFLTKGVQDFDRIMGVEVKWPSGYVTGILDISYIGAAIIKSSKITEKFQRGDEVEFFFSFEGGKQNVAFDAEVIREDDKVLAVYFPELSLQARQALDDFLKLKLVGLNTKLVDSKYYIKEQGFDYWFHGPHQTNIFIWGTLDNIKKATIEMNYQVVTFEDGKLFLSESKRFLEVPTEDYAYRVNNPELKNVASKSVARDVVSLLSQIEDSTGIIKKLSSTLSENFGVK
jgi:hypothetical protein